MPGFGAIAFRPLTRPDLVRLGQWLNDPVGHRWWPDPQPADELEVDYRSCIDGTGATEVFFIELDEQPVGRSRAEVPGRGPGYLLVCHRPSPGAAQ